MSLFLNGCVFKDHHIDFIENTGNYYLYEIVKLGDDELRIELEDQAGELAYAGYTNFMIRGPSTFYELKVSGFYGNASMLEMAELLLYYALTTQR